jgi:major membrane immunogen (membrane-anchored lipoprotein)
VIRKEFHRMKKGMLNLCAALSLLFVLSVAASGCGGAASSVSVEGCPDGSYTGKSSEDENGAYGEVTIAVADGKVTDCSYVTWQKDGSIKDEDYGKVNGEISNQEYYDKAQLAVDAMEKYARQFKETGELSSVDAVSGATNSYDQFTEAVEDALADQQAE